MIEISVAGGHATLSRTQVFMVMGRWLYLWPKMLSRSQGFPWLFWQKIWLGCPWGREDHGNFSSRSCALHPPPLSQKLWRSDDFGTCPRTLVSWCPLYLFMLSEILEWGIEWTVSISSMHSRTAGPCSKFLYFPYSSASLASFIW